MRVCERVNVCAYVRAPESDEDQLVVCEYVRRRDLQPTRVLGRPSGEDTTQQVAPPSRTLREAFTGRLVQCGRGMGPSIRPKAI